MNGNSARLPESWLCRLGRADASGWLTAFQVDPAAAVNELLWNRFYFGPLNPIERGQLLASWLEALGDDEDFASRLDIQLSNWVESTWGKFTEPGVLLASAWSCLGSVVEFSAKLRSTSGLVKTAETLRDRFPERLQFLGSFSTTPASDPLGVYLAVVAEFQGDDRSLAGFWHRLCDLPDGVPFYHARYAILGLRRLKALSDWENNTLRAEVVLGLLRLASAFDRLVRERGLPENIAKTSFRRVASRLEAAYPDSPRWSEHGAAVLLKMAARPREWVVECIRPLALAIAQEQARANTPHARPRRSIQPDRSWAPRANELAEAIGRGFVNRLADIERLLNEQRFYTQATGDTYHIVRSLCNFASRIHKIQPVLAAEWAEEARCWDPHNCFTWNTTIQILLKQHQVNSALTFAWVAWKRFPEDVFTRNGLAEVLKAAGRLDEAEAIYRETIDHFPEDVVARTGLAEVLKAAGRLDEAEATYRKAKIHFPEDVVARTGLAEVLKAAGKLDEAEAIYREAKNRFPENVFARNGLADTLRRARRYAEAETVLRESIADGSVDCVTYVELAHLLLHQGGSGRAAALHMLDEGLRLDGRNPHALNLKQELEQAHGAAISAIATEWDAKANDLLSAIRGMEAEAKEEIEGDESVQDDLEPETRSARGLEAVLQPEAEQEAVPLERPTLMPAPSPASSRRHPSADPLEIAALLAEASFYRSCAARSSCEAAAQHRQKADELLIRAEQLAPGDAGVAAERLTLQRSQTPTDTISSQLTTELGIHPNSPPLLLLKARLERDKARQARSRLSEESMATLLEAPNRLRGLDGALMPVFHLDKGLAALALVDGATRLEIAADAFTHFRQTVVRRASEERVDREAAYHPRAKKTPGFHEWLQQTTNDRLFRGFREQAAVATDEVTALEQSLASDPSLFEEIEDVMVSRLSIARL